MKEKREIIDFIENYLYDRNLYLNNEMNKTDEALICEVISNAIQSKPHKRPDGYAEVDGAFYIIEHFQFDASIEKPKMGSEQSRKMVEFSKNAEDNKRNCGRRIETQSNKITYLNNLIKHFESHCKNYEAYKNEISEINKENKNIGGLVLFIEDKTFFGVINADLRTPLEVVLTNEFANVWSKYTFVKFIVFGGTCMNEKYCAAYSLNSIKGKLRSIMDCDALVMNNTNIIDFKEGFVWKK